MPFSTPWLLACTMATIVEAGVPPIPLAPARDMEAAILAIAPLGSPVNKVDAALAARGYQRSCSPSPSRWEPHRPEEYVRFERCYPRNDGDRAPTVHVYFSLDEAGNTTDIIVKQTMNWP